MMRNSPFWGYPGFDGGAPAPCRGHAELSAVQRDALPHAEHAEMIAGEVLETIGYLETAPIIAHPHHHPVGELHLDADHGGAGVCDRVAQALLGDAKQREFEVAVEPPLLADDRQADVGIAGFSDR